MSVIDEAGDYYRTTVSSQLSHQDILKVIFYMYYVIGCPYQILTAFDKCQWNGGIPSSFYQIMIVFKQAGDYSMDYSCFLSIKYWWTWTNGRFNSISALYRLSQVTEVVLHLSHTWWPSSRWGIYQRLSYLYHIISPFSKKNLKIPKG
jgi:hypothetical protein